MDWLKDQLTVVEADLWKRQRHQSFYVEEVFGGHVNCSLPWCLVDELHGMVSLKTKLSLLDLRHLSRDVRKRIERFVDYDNTFGTTEEPACMVPVETDVQVGVVQSKKWFEWQNKSSPLLVSSTSSLGSSSRIEPRTAAPQFQSASSFATSSKFSSRWVSWLPAG
jgi:hypothetical protein